MIMMTHSATKVCPWCKGEGTTQAEIDGETLTIPCGLCNGNGYVRALNGEGRAYQSGSSG